MVAAAVIGAGVLAAGATAEQLALLHRKGYAVNDYLLVYNLGETIDLDRGLDHAPLTADDDINLS